MNENITITDSIQKLFSDGSKKVIVTLQCNIETSKSVNFLIDIHDEEAYILNKDVIDTRIAKFKTHCKERAELLGCGVFIWE